MMSRSICTDCNDTKEIETEGVIMGRSYYSKKEGRMVVPYVGDGKWIKTQCPCVGENND